MILVDTSVWIAYFRGESSPEVQRLLLALQEGEDVAICGLILTEILQGIPDDTRCEAIRRWLDALLYLPIHRDAYLLAADLYRAARREGQTVRNSVDCIVAASAILAGVPLLHSDRDYAKIAAVSELETVQV